MQLYEFQAKRIFQEYGVPIPSGRLATTVEEAVRAANELGGPVAIKAQVLAGGRGLAGGVKFGRDPEEVRSVASQIFNMTVRGERPRAVLVEEKVEAVRELYAAVTWDYLRKRPVVVASSRGGVDIEALAKDLPTAVARKHIDPFKGFKPYHGRALAAQIGLSGNDLLQYANTLNTLWCLFEKHDAELVEANPLALLENGKLVTLDAKLNLDDRSIFRQSTLITRIEQLAPYQSEGLDYRRARARELGIPTYVEMEGNIGVVADGAGSGMLTLDMIVDAGGKTQVYCEMGGGATPELMGNTMAAALTVQNVRVLLINLIGGLNRMDEMARGITSYLAKHPTQVPILVRMSGTMEEEGRRILTNNGIQFFADLHEAVEKGVSLSRGD